MFTGNRGFLGTLRVERREQVRCEVEMGAFHALACDKLVRDAPQGVRGPLHEQHLHHMTVLQQDVLGRDDLRDVLAAYARQVF
jgi:hypothetical protein